MAAIAMHKAVTLEIATQRAELEAADRRIAATPPESESEEPADSNDSDAESSSEENCWESAAGGLSAAAAAEERWSSASLESTDFSEAEQGSTDPSDDYSEEEWEGFRKRMD
jgi:hypothetical protein